MHYYRLVGEPSQLEHNGQKVNYFTVMPTSEGIEERNAPVIGCEHDLKDESRLRMIKMMSPVDILFDNKRYEYRTHIVGQDGKLVVETEMGF